MTFQLICVSNRMSANNMVAINICEIYGCVRFEFTVKRIQMFGRIYENLLKLCTPFILITIHNSGYFDKSWEHPSIQVPHINSHKISKTFQVCASGTKTLLYDRSLCKTNNKPQRTWDPHNCRLWNSKSGVPLAKKQEREEGVELFYYDARDNR